MTPFKSTATLLIALFSIVQAQAAPGPGNPGGGHGPGYPGGNHGPGYPGGLPGPGAPYYPPSNPGPGYGSGRNDGYVLTTGGGVVGTYYGVVYVNAGALAISAIAGLLTTTFFILTDRAHADQVLMARGDAYEFLQGDSQTGLLAEMIENARKYVRDQNPAAAAELTDEQIAVQLLLSDQRLQ